MRVGLIIAGIVAGAIGLDIWINQGGSLYRQPVPQFTGIILIIFGFFLLVTGLCKSRSYKSTKNICPKCEQIVESSENTETHCSRCDLTMEPLKGFYDRYPKKKGSSL